MTTKELSSYIEQNYHKHTVLFIAGHLGITTKQVYK
jgi:hypothetical protein